MSQPPPLQTITCTQPSSTTILISYNTPSRLNAFDPQQYLDLKDALLWARDNSSVNVIIITGKGKHFCAGRSMTSNPSDISSEVSAGHALSSVLTNYPKVIIAAVHGAAIGWGCTQLTAFDLIYAHTSTAFFQTPFASLGITPEGGSSYAFPKAMGKARANVLLLAGERLSAHEAWVGGLVTETIDAETREEFLEKVVEKAIRIGGYSGEALRVGKRLVAEATDDGEVRRKTGERERKEVLRMFETEDTKKRLAEFGRKKDKAKM